MIALIARGNVTQPIATPHGQLAMPQSFIRLFILLVAMFAASCVATSAAGVGEPPADAAKVLVRYQWTAADGAASPSAFNVRRAEGPNGPFEAVNTEPIRVPFTRAGDVVTLTADVGLQRGRTYWYYLEGVGKDGRARKLTDAAPAVANLPLAPEDLAAWRLAEQRRTAAKHGSTARK